MNRRDQEVLHLKVFVDFATKHRTGSMCAHRWSIVKRTVGNGYIRSIALLMITRSALAIEFLIRKLCATGPVATNGTLQ